VSGRGGAILCRPGCRCGRHPPYPWHALTEAALAYAAAESEREFTRATHRLISAAKRYRDDPRKPGRPAASLDTEGRG
jgi:ketosteroid isomerase-like protein